MKSEQQRQQEKRAKVQKEVIYKGKILSLRKEIFQIDQQKPHEYAIITHPGAVAIIPVNQKGDLVLIKQWRRAAGKILLEIPAGTLEDNEAPLECAKRELQEETGYKADTLISLGGFYTAPGYCTEYLHLFIAKDLSPSPLPPDDHEMIDVVEIRLDAALNLIYEHKIEDAKTIAGILHYKYYESQK